MATNKKHIPYYVIHEDVNRKEFSKYDVMVYLINSYNEIKKKIDRPVTFEQFKEFVQRKSSYMFWCRCEYECILKSWVGFSEEKKFDIHDQIMMNIDIVTYVLMKNVLKFP